MVCRADPDRPYREFISGQTRQVVVGLQVDDDPQLGDDDGAE
jgi:hypothetical protein